MTSITSPERQAFLNRNLMLGIRPAHLLLFAIILLSATLHLVNIQSIGDGNTYYTAAVESMLQSWKNFFFVAAEPGGSVSVDKPPLGLWIEASFAYFLGVSGVTVSLPNMIAGILCIPLLYHLVRKYLGELAGLVASLVLAVTPVAVATNRNNTIDGMLVFTLLLAAWAFIKATESGKSRWLFLGAFIVGLGFNIKMLQAFLPLPAFYALYLFGSKKSWFRKFFNLWIATAILLIVSLSWAVVVDFTPADQRPYVGSSDNNSVMELILGHNGLSRLFNPRAVSNVPTQSAGLGPDGDNLAYSAGSNPGQRGLQPPPQENPPTLGISPPDAGLTGGSNLRSDGGPSASGTPFSQETGSPGILRFFTDPLSKQMSWVLPFALISIGLGLVAVRVRIPLTTEHKALVLWGGWLLVCLIFFSFVEGIFHAYYAIMLAPALGAVVGGGFSQLWRWQTKRSWARGVLLLAAMVTISFQLFTTFQNGIESAWVYLPVAWLVVGAGLFLFKNLRPTAYLIVLVAMLIIPTIWTSLTVLENTPNVNLPTAYGGTIVRQNIPGPAPGMTERSASDQELVSYLLSNTQDVSYLAAVPSSQIGASLVLETGRPVLYMGGFNGGDPVIDADGLSEMVGNGELRYVVMSGGRNDQQEITNWLASACTIVPEFSQNVASQNSVQQRPGNNRQPPGNQATVLHDCRG